MRRGAPSLQSARLLDQIRKRVWHQHYSLKPKNIKYIDLIFTIEWFFRAIQTTNHKLRAATKKA
jgi:hypothetical protein